MIKESRNEMAYVLAQDVRTKISDKIDSAGNFSVSGDTTPGTSNQNKLVVTGRWGVRKSN